LRTAAGGGVYATVRNFEASVVGARSLKLAVVTATVEK
jgi:hypothetical protein